MSIYNEQYLQEMKTKEEYRRESFKKKYNYKPSKENKDIGTIEVDGSKYKVDIRKGKHINSSSNIFSKTPELKLDDKFFKLKGSNKNQRRDAILQHEIGHSNLHNINPNNRNIDKSKKSTKIYKNLITDKFKHQNGIDLSKNVFNNMHAIRKKIYDANNGGIQNYIKDIDKSVEKNRNKSYNIAKKYELNNDHTKAYEFEADRYAANRTSTKAVRKALRNDYSLAKKKNTKIINKSISKLNPSSDKDNIKKLKKTLHDYNVDTNLDLKQRSKALKDKNLRNSEFYK